MSAPLWTSAEAEAATGGTGSRAWQATGLSIDLRGEGDYDTQFKRALELNATHTVRLERQPDGALVAKLKHLATRSETVLQPDELIARLTTKP